jgi:hypothetical protein
MQFGISQILTTVVLINSVFSRFHPHYNQSGSWKKPIHSLRLSPVFCPSYFNRYFLSVNQFPPCNEKHGLEKKGKVIISTFWLFWALHTNNKKWASYFWACLQTTTTSASLFFLLMQRHTGTRDGGHQNRETRQGSLEKERE